MDFAFYHLTGDPFSSRLEPNRLFWNPRHQKAFQSLIYGIEGGKGLMALLGERGVGKKTLLYAYLAKRKQNNVRVMSFSGADCTFSTILDRLCHHCGIVRTEVDTETTLHRIRATLAREHEQGNRLVLIIEGAEELPTTTLDRLLLLANMTDVTGKLLQMILLGGPAFSQYLNKDASPQLKEQIDVRVLIEPLTSQESLAYVQHRIDNMAVSKEPLFTRKALRLIIRYAKGNPGTLNYLCGEALNTARFNGQRPIDADTVRDVLRDVEGKPASPFLRRALAGLAVACVVGIFVFSLEHLDRLQVLWHQVGIGSRAPRGAATADSSPSRVATGGGYDRPGIKSDTPKPDGPELTDVDPSPLPVTPPVDETPIQNQLASPVSPHATEGVLPQTSLPVNAVLCVTARPRGERRRDIILMDANGAIRRQLVADGALNLAPVLSPDGTLLAYTSYREGTPALYLRHLERNQDERITSGAGFAMPGSWSPNGRYLALGMSENGNSDIFLYDTNQRQLSRLTTDPGIDISPSFAPDSTRLAFTSNRTGSSQIYLTTVKDTEPVRITSSGLYNTSAVWAPKGDTIAFIGQSSNQTLDIYTIRADGTGLRRMTTGGSTVEEDPSWAPDGQSIMFTRNHDGVRERRIVDVESLNDRELPGHGAVCHSPQWVAQRMP